ncbi:MAG: hypothetical protein MUO53_00150 [Maribacter sp.]|nr:hypothetical protein [Maribacter sp.]
MCNGNNPPPPSGKPVVITLTVEASSLYAAVDPNQEFVDSKCSLLDDNGGNSVDVKTFESNVYLNNNVRWVGATKFPLDVDKDYSIAIDSIRHEATPQSDPTAPTNENFFSSVIINGGGGRSSNVNAVVNNNSNLINQLDVYTINFSVYPKGNNPKPFHIDPKLRGNP